VSDFTKRVRACATLWLGGGGKADALMHNQTSAVQQFSAELSLLSSRDLSLRVVVGFFFLGDEQAGGRVGRFYVHLGGCAAGFFSFFGDREGVCFGNRVEPGFDRSKALRRLI
jgi:hypothetical protein